MSRNRDDLVFVALAESIRLLHCYSLRDTVRCMKPLHPQRESAKNISIKTPKANRTRRTQRVIRVRFLDLLGDSSV